MTDQPIQVSVGWVVNIKVSTTDVIDGCIVYHEGTTRKLQGGVGVGREDGVAGLSYSCGDLEGWVNGKLQLGYYFTTEILIIQMIIISHELPLCKSNLRKLKV